MPPAKIERLLPAYRSEGDRLVLFDEPTTGKWSRPPTFEHGAAGLVSTVDDYLAFARMLLADGRHRGQPLLTPASAKAMKTNHLTASQRAGGEMILGRGRGWGYGMSPRPSTFPKRETFRENHRQLRKPVGRLENVKGNVPRDAWNLLLVSGEVRFDIVRERVLEWPWPCGG